MKKTYLLMPFLALALASCSNEDDVAAQGAQSALNVKVALDNPASREMIEGEYFDSGTNIGIFLTEPDGSDYDNQTNGYLNVMYTSNGTELAQTWTSLTPIMLSATTGTAVAYHPHMGGANGMMAIPLETTSQTDYMYSNKVEVSNSSTTAEFHMQHALTAIRINILNEGYSGAGEIQSIAITSDNFANEGVMDITTGTVTFTEDTECDNYLLPVTDGSKTVAGAPYTNAYMFVPTGTNAPINIAINMDGKTYNNVVNLTDAAKKGYIYTVNLSAKNNSLSVLKVTIERWKDGDTIDGDMQISGSGN